MNSPRDRWLAVNHAATIFVSAFLLFQIQPLVSKYILPWFGGSPAVWTTCMLFFQSLLFAGYAYAHFSDRWLRPRQQAVVHIGLIALAIALLRVIPSDAWKPIASQNPVGEILVLLAACVGLPYFVLSSTGPLIQAWFARSFPGRVPYRLYALSNFGSLLALLSYPFVFERIFDIRRQAAFWSWGFVLYALLCGSAAICLWAMSRSITNRRDDPPAMAAKQATSAAAKPPEPPHWWQPLLWLSLPAFASVVLLATTNHVCTDIAVIPFLWVIPLALYLLTFIIAFDHPRWYRPMWVAAFTLLAIYLLAMVYSHGQSRIVLFTSGTPGKIALEATKLFHSGDADLPSPEFQIGFPVYVSLNFAAMFGICMLCHGELVRIRPDPKYLTMFYLMIAAGGALGGVAVAFYAPIVFHTFFEFNLSLYIGFVLAVVLFLRGIVRFTLPRILVARSRWLLGAASLAAVFTLLIGGFGFYDVLGYLKRSEVGVELWSRNFFGTLTIVERNAGDPWNRDYALFHGRITHGTQFANPQRRHAPTTYYSPESGVGRTIGYYRQNPDLDGMRIGAVGLGAGTLAAYVGPQDYIRFYEINPAVIAIALSGDWFTYLKDCQGKLDVELGDARLSLERELRDGQPQRFDVLVLDAFSGDAIPMHLLTEEAFETYLDHLATPDAGGLHGAIAVHITNKYVDLVPVVHALANRFDFRRVIFVTGDDPDNDVYESHWMILSRNEELIRQLLKVAPPFNKPPKPPILWTDAKSNLFEVFKW